MGWARAFSRVKHRVLRLNDTARNIALGLAIGAGVSFSPLMFTHFIQGAILALILRANIPAALIGTIVGNPWTFPFFWWASLYLGSAIFNAMGVPVEANLPTEVSLPILWDMLWHEPLRLLAPWMLGGYLLCVIVIVVSYPLYLNLIKAAKLARTKAMQRKAHKAAKEITGQDQ